MISNEGMEITIRQPKPKCKIHKDGKHKPITGNGCSGCEKVYDVYFFAIG